MTSEEFAELLSIYQRQHYAIRLKNPENSPTLQESVWAYGLEVEFYVIALMVLASVVRDAKANSFPFADVELDIVSKMTAEQIYATCQTLLKLKQEDVDNICSKFKEFT